MDRKWANEVHNKKWFVILYDLYVKKQEYGLTEEQVQKVLRKLDEFKKVIERISFPNAALWMDLKKYHFEAVTIPENAVAADGWR